MRTHIRLMFLVLWIVISHPLAVWAADVTLAWDPISDSNTAGYRLYAREHDERYDYAHPEWEGDMTQCTVTGFDEYESYYFVVRAVDSNGNESGDSNEVYWSPSGAEEPGGGTHDSLNGGGGGSAGGGGCFIESIFGD